MTLYTLSWVIIGKKSWPKHQDLVSLKMQFCHNLMIWWYDDMALKCINLCIKCSNGIGVWNCHSYECTPRNNIQCFRVCSFVKCAGKVDHHTHRILWINRLISDLLYDCIYIWRPAAMLSNWMETHRLTLISNPQSTPLLTYQMTVVPVNVLQTMIH